MRPFLLNDIFSMPKMTECEEDLSVHVRDATQVNSFERSRLDQETTLSLDFKVEYLEDFRSDRIVSSRLFPALRIGVDQQSSETDVQ
jgi:hypothetical protein